MGCPRRHKSNMSTARVLRFGPFELDVRAGELRKQGVRIRLPDQACQILLMLLEHPGEVVLRDDIRQQLWPDETVVDFDRSINAAIWRLRNALGDSADQPRFIETLAKRGYRFLRPVEIVADSPPVPETRTAPPETRAPVEELPDKVEGVWAGGAEALAQPAHLRRPFMAAAVFIGIGMGIGLGYGFLRNARLDRVTVPLSVSRLTATGDILSAAISPDGRYVAYLRSAEGVRSIWLKQPNIEGDIQLVNCGQDRCGGVTFSPDGGMLYFTRRAAQTPDGPLYRIPVLGSTPEPVFSGISGAPAFSPDGKRVAFVRSTRASHGQDVLFTRALSGGGEREVARYPAPGIRHAAVVWTSDGKRLVYVALGKLTSIAASGGQATPFPDQGWSKLEDIAASPYAGAEILVAGSRLGTSSPVQIFRVSVPGGDAWQLTHDGNSLTSVHGAASGDLVVLQEDLPRSIQVVRNGVAAPVMNGERQDIGGVSWTPDGRILFASRAAANERSDLWVVNPDGSGRQRITHSTGSVYYYDAVMPRSGDFVIATVWSLGDKANIWRLNVAAGTTQRLTYGEQDFPATLSPDDKWVVYKSVQSDKPVVMKVPSEGGVASQVTTYACDYPVVSPDGRWIACLSPSEPSKVIEILIVPFEGGPPAKRLPLPSTTKLDVGLAWTPNGGAVSFVNRVNGVGNVWSQPLSGRSPYPETRFSSQETFHFNWSRDGRLVLARGENTTDVMLVRGLPGR